MGRGCISRRRLPSLARHETGVAQLLGLDIAPPAPGNPTPPIGSGLPLSHTMGAAPSGNMDALPNPLSSKGAMAPAATGTGLKPPSPMTASTIYSLLRALTLLLPTTRAAPSHSPSTPLSSPPPSSSEGQRGAMASPLPVVQPQPVPSGYEAHETRFPEILKSDLALPARVWP